MTDIYGRSNDVFPNGIYTTDVSSLDETTRIDLGDGEININAPLVLVNGTPISGGAGGFVTNPMSAELNANDNNILNAGTVLATSFVKNGGTSQQYLMGDGSSLQYSANSGNSNFYLYDNGIDQAPTPPNGYITYNTTEQKQATVIYISHRTRDNIDIEVFFRNISSLNTVYLQDQSNSDNNITYDIIGPPVIVNQAQITIPVAQTSSNGTGSTSFGNGHNILLSFFTNSIETDARLTTLESKTQLITATSTKTILEKSSQCKLTSLDNFSVTLDVGLDTFPKFVISGTQVSSLIPMNMSNQILSGLPTPIGNDDAVNKLYVDDLTTPLTTKMQNMTATASGNVINKNSSFVLRNVEADTFLIKSDSNASRLTVSNTNAIINGIPLLMQGQRIRDVGSPTGVSDVAVVSALTPGSVPYFTSTNRLSGSAQNLYVQLGDSTIQSGIDAITAGGAVGGSVQVSSGGSTQNVICPRQNYTLVGAVCPPFTQTTQITGNLTIGSAAFISTRVRVSHMKFVGNLVFDNSTNQQLRTYFYNCDWNGTITFPTSAATGAAGTQIFFDSCSFSGASAIVIPNQNLYTIFFTRCSFIGQTITNQQVVGNTTKTIFNDCSYLPALNTLGFCVLNGPNTTLSTTQANYGSIVLGGSSSSILLGNGSVRSGTSSQYVMGDGTLFTPVIPAITSLTGNATYNGVNIGYTARRVGVSGAGICTVFIGGFSATAATTTSTLVSSSFLPATYRPQNAIFIPCRITKLGAITLGILIVFASGEIGVTDVALTANFWTAGNTGCGIAGDFTVSFTTV